MYSGIFGSRSAENTCSIKTVSQLLIPLEDFSSFQASLRTTLLPVAYPSTRVKNVSLIVLAFILT